MGQIPGETSPGIMFFCNDLKNWAVIILYAVCNNNGCMMYRQIAHEYRFLRYNVEHERRSPEELAITGQPVKKTEKRKEASTWHG